MGTRQLQGKKQIPYGDDNKKANKKGKCRSKRQIQGSFAALRMTARQTTAEATTAEKTNKGRAKRP
jgi:hypothetical protein